MWNFLLALFVFGVIIIMVLSPVLLVAIPAAIAWYNHLDFWHTVMFFGGIGLLLLAVAYFVTR